MKFAIAGSLLICALIAGSSLRCHAQSRTGNGPYTKVEKMAQVLRSHPLERESVKDLAHEILMIPHTYSVPSPVSAFLEDKITNAEINFRAGSGRGVSEQELVNFANWLQEKLQLPEYLKTTPAQVRTIRMKLAISSPYTMGDTLGGSGILVGQHVHAEVSPLQAMHLLGVLMDQKILNPEYQDPSIDLISAERKRNKASIGSPRNARLGTLTAQESARKRQIRNSISSSASTLSMQDGFEIIHHAFSTFHLD